MMVLSIIIPFYNSGLYIQEALDSIALSYFDYDYEIIIIDDGSTDIHSLEVLRIIEEDGKCLVLHQSNAGPATARNAGCKMAKGEYLFFLDSDNKVGPYYFKKAFDYLKEHPDYGVVYANPQAFGDGYREAVFRTMPFDIMANLVQNHIDMCAMVRKQVWIDCGGFNESESLIGIEDWDFWLTTYEKGWEFKYLNETLYHYRIRKDSLTRSNKIDRQQRIAFVYQRHALLLAKYYPYLFAYFQIYQQDKQRPFRSCLKYLKDKFRGSEFSKQSLY